MYKIKQIPEDFVVREIITPHVTITDGYLLYWLHKRNYNSMKAVEDVAKALNIPSRSIGFAGNKDKNAVTEQLISIRGVKKDQIDRLKLKDIELHYVGTSDQPVSMGTLDGNSFEITVRNITEKEYDALLKKDKSRIPNIFGEQRFSENNSDVGKLLVKRDFKRAVGLILKGKGEDERGIAEFLIKAKNNYVGALRLIPKKTLLLYVHSYQSLLWNETALSFLKKHHKVEPHVSQIPMIGFGMQVKDKDIKVIIDRIMAKEKLKERDFIIREIPELSAEGVERSLFMEVKNLDVSRLEDDELNKGKKKVTLKFNLDKGSYATVAIEHMFKR